MANPRLVSRGKNEGDECRGAYNPSIGGWGPAYENACIYSGTIRASSDLPTTWYNYTLASAGTIIDKDTDSENPATNTSKAAESICPKGWTLPANEQINVNRDVASFSPILGGFYGSGTLYDESSHGIWWGSESSNNASRYNLGYGYINNTGILFSSDYARFYGFYIRCVPAP